MIIATLDSAQRYESLLPGLAAALRWLRETDLAALPPGRAEIEGERLWADVIHAPARPRGEAKLEVHRRYADVQFLVSGEEELGWRPAAECLEPAGEYNAAADAGFFADAPQVWHSLVPGSFAVFFPEDAHAPLVGQGEIRKVVVKVLV